MKLKNCIAPKYTYNTYQKLGYFYTGWDNTGNKTFLTQIELQDYKGKINAILNNSGKGEIGKVLYVGKGSNAPRHKVKLFVEENKIKKTTIIENSDIVIIATPSAFLTKLFENFEKELLKNKIVFSAVKGIIPEFNAIPARFIHKSFATPYNNIGIICGPCHAEEVALERLSYLTIACENNLIAKEMSELLNCRYIKTTLSDDLFGTEFSAILKNVYALCSGISAGLGYGDNFQAVLIANKSLSTSKEAILAKLLFRIDSVQRGQNVKYVVLNAKESDLDKIKSLLPGMKAPSVMPLAEPGWVSIHSVISENDFWDIIEALREAGAQGILVLPIEKMIL